MKRAVIVLAVLVVLILAGAFTLWYIGTYWTLDRNGMENPDFQGEPEMLDGDFTYVDNEALLEKIRGTWVSGDERYTLTIRDEGDIALSLEGETVLEDQLQFTYLQPGYVGSTEFSLDSYTLKRGDGTPVGETGAFRHESGENGGRILMEVAYEDGGSETVTFKKTT